ncbi:unnamed protein product, partial [marine sediment metagenome]
MPGKLINRKVHYAHAQIYDSEDKSGANNTWIYHRAPEGFLFRLVAVDISTGCDSAFFYC